MSAVGAFIERYRQNVEPLRSERRIELAVVFVVVCIFLQLCWLAFREFSRADVEVLAPASDSLAVVEASAVVSLDTQQSLQLQSRPLFWTSRRPVDEVRVERMTEPADGAAARRLENFQLTGVVGAGDTGMAIVAYGQKKLRMSVGDELEGWTLREVDPQEVVFVSAGARDVRRLMPVPVAAEPEIPPEPSTQPASAAPRGTDPAMAAGESPDEAAGQVTAQAPKRAKLSLSLGGSKELQQ